MRHSIMGVLLATIVPMAMYAQQPAGQSPLVFDGVTVIDVEHGTTLPAQRVVVAGNRIESMGSTASIAMPLGAHVIHAQGKYLIPGLWDMHVHVMGYPQVAYPLLIANGVTGIRDMHPGFSSFDSLKRWQDEIVTGKRVGPRMLLTGGFLGGPSGSVGFPSDDQGAFRAKIEITTPERARIVVDSLVVTGVDFIKIRDGLSREVYFAIAAETRRLGIPLAGHFPGGGVTLLEASDSGQRSIEHGWPSVSFGPEHSDEECAALAAHLRANNTWFTPTFVLPRYFFGGVAPDRLRFWPRSVRNNRISNTSSPAAPLVSQATVKVMGRIQRAGGLLFLAGTDAASLFPENTPGISLHEEVAAFVEAGIGPAEALRIATFNPAKYLGGTDSLGTVAPGKLADLVLLDANPLEDIHNTTKIRAVVANGRYYDRTALDRLIAGVEARAKAEP